MGVGPVSGWYWLLWAVLSLCNVALWLGAWRHVKRAETLLADVRAALSPDSDSAGGESDE